MTEPSTPLGPKASTGIPGFDEMTGGGLPRSRITVLLGSAGAGKTVFALQTLVCGATGHHEPGIFVAFEEDSRRIMENAESFGWDLPALERDRLFFLDAYVSPTLTVAGDFDLEGILAQVAHRAGEIGATRIVFDGIDVLLSLLDGPVVRRREVYRLYEWLAERDFTALLTVKAEGPNLLADPEYQFLPFMADAVVMLQHAMRERVSVRSVRVVKYRGSGFSENEYPLTITSSGIEVATYGRTELQYPVFREKLSTGVPRLDAMLGDGCFRGSSVLITGVPGTAKTTLAGTFADRCCRGGERVMFLSFDEPAAQIVRNLSSVGLDLGRWVREGLLDLWSLRSEARSVEEHLIDIKRRIEKNGPSVMIVDPLSALAKAGGEVAAVDASLRLLDYAKSRGITALCTSLQSGNDPVMENSSLEVSTIADTWLHLAYRIRGGERNRSLTVIKSRGMAHSNQVRELVLSGDGITLSDVYSAGGEVLMGTARWEKEEEMRREAEAAERETRRRRAEMDAAAAAVRARMEQLARELKALEAEREALAADAAAQSAARRQAVDTIGVLRRGDADATPPATHAIPARP
jgi:circadian clock protein KaiC